MPKATEIRQVCQAGKDRDPGWYRIHRRLSIHVTALLVDTPITMNQVSLLMMGMAATGAALLTSHQLWVNALGGVCLYLSFVLDKVDGEIARYRGLQAPIGILLDRFHHRLMEPLVFLALGWREWQSTHSVMPLFAALATMLAANIVEEVQHLPAYIAAKHARETRDWPSPDVAGPPRWLERVAGVMRSLKTFRTFITVVPLALGAIFAEALSGRPVITWLLLTSAVALWVYVVFQAFYYANGGLDAKMAEHTESLPPLPPLPPRLRSERPAPAPSRTPTLSLVSSGRHPRGQGQPGPAGRTLLVLLALGVCAGRSSAATYYVDNSTASCSNTGAGTQSQPYCTISAALAARGVAGNTILVKPGIYPETVTLPASGTSANPLVIRAFSGPVIVDGADDFSATNKWTNTTGNIWRASTVNWSPKQVFADGARLTITTANTNSIPAGTFKYVSGSGLYVNLGVSGNPGTHDMKVGRRNYAIVLSGKSWITIDGLTATRTEDRGVYISNASNDIQFINGKVSFANKYGIYFSEGARARIANCVVTDNANHGIILTTGATECVVENNESARNAVPGSRSANGLYMYGTTNSIIRNNRWHDNQDTGQHFQSASNNNVSYNNISWANGDHGYDHLGATGTFHTNDVSFGNYKDGFSIEGGATGTRLYNCISVDNGISTGEYDLWVSNDSKTGFTSNDNMFWNSTSAPPVRYGSSTYSSVATYASASGQDSRSKQQDPRFVDAASGNFHPSPGSPAIDNGNSSVANWPATDAEGNARVDDPASSNVGLGPVNYADRGALEFQINGLAPVADLLADPALANAPALVTLDASSSFDPDGSIVSYEFDFGDGVSTAPQAGPIAMHTYTAGTYHAIVEVTDDMGLNARDTVVVIVNALPVAALTATPSSGKAPLTVNLNAGGSTDADGGIVSYRFDFGDGVTLGPQGGSTASHLYGSGTWKVQVTVTDTRGATDTLNTALTVTVGPPNVPPTAAMTLSPTSGQAPLAVTANASGSSDPDGGIVSYQFTFADTIVVGPQAGSSATRTLGAGMNRVSVVVTDTDGATASFTDSLLVIPPAPDQPPVVVAPPTATVAEGGTLSLAITASDPDGQALTSLDADLSQLPSGNDASFVADQNFTSGTLTWHPTFAHAGTYSVTFTAGNALTGQASTEVTVTPVDRAPVVSGPTVVSGPVEQLVSFSIAAADPDGDAIATLTADWSSLPGGNDAAFSPGSGNTSGTFTWTPGALDTGSFVVTFQATNALSGSLTTSVRIGVADVAPDVVAAATAQATENAPFSFVVTASDPNGDPIASMVADLSGLPAANNAVFTPAANNLGGTLTWTPTFADSGSYVVRFMASNALADTATTVVNVANVDRAPIVTAPVNAGGPALTNLTINVTAVDPDGDVITSLAANMSQLPAGHTATFTLSGGAAAGLFSWTPASTEQGVYDITFTGSNALSGQATTRLTVTAPNQAPTAVLGLTPSIGNAPLLVTASGSGSTDPEGAALTYRFDFGDGTIVGPQSSPTATHTFAAGTWTVQLTVTDPLGAIHSTSATVTASAAGPGPNLVTNPSFESNSNGWNSYSGGVLLRVAGGYDGAWAMQVTGGVVGSSFGLNDSPNWVAVTPSVGTRYRFTAWVRSASSVGSAKLLVREYQGGTKIGGTTTSPLVPLTTAWQMVTVDHVVQQAGTTLDFQIADQVVVANEVFLSDNVSIYIIPPSQPAALMAGAEDAITTGPSLQFGAWVTPSVVRADATLSFVTTRPGAVRADLFDASGRLVRSLVNDADVAPGMHRIPVDGRSDRGDRLESGMYFFRVQATERTAVGKLVFTR